MLQRGLDFSRFVVCLLRYGVLNRAALQVQKNAGTMQDASQNLKLDFLVGLIEGMKGDTLESHTRFVSAFEALPETNFTMPEWKKVVDFAVHQFSQWQVRWLFSPASDPDVNARSESEAWDKLCISFSKTLIENAPEVERPLQQAKDLIVAQRILARRLQDRRGGAAFWGTLGYFGRFLNTVGFRGAARSLYRIALYPSGTVGRLGG